MSAGVRACPICGSGNATVTARCWVCGADLAAAAPPSAAAAPAPATTYDASTRTLQMVGWSALLLGLGFTALLIAVELALEWPGMLIPYAVVVLVAFVALGRTAYVQLRRKPGAVEARPTTAAEGAPAPTAAPRPRTCCRPWPSAWRSRSRSSQGSCSSRSRRW